MISAYDMGEPSLYSVATILVNVHQVVTVPPNTGVGFQDLQNVIQVFENTPQVGLKIRLIFYETKRALSNYLRKNCLHLKGPN